jgi:hypothetical protein
MQGQKGITWNRDGLGDQSKHLFRLETMGATLFNADSNRNLSSMLFCKDLTEESLFCNNIYGCTNRK